MYYVIGDSHTATFSSQATILPANIIVKNNQFNCYHVGPILAYNAIGVVNNIQTTPSDSTIFCFGEIDMRNIHKRITANTSDYKTEINNVLDNYINAIELSNHSNKIAFGVVPCLKEVPFYNWFENNLESKDHFYAPAGDLSTRNMYKKYFNSQLQLNCELKGVKYFDIFDEVLGKEELYMDDIHLSSPKVFDTILNKLNELQNG